MLYYTRSIKTTLLLFLIIINIICFREESGPSEAELALQVRKSLILTV